MWPVRERGSLWIEIVVLARLLLLDLNDKQKQSTCVLIFAAQWRPKSVNSGNDRTYTALRPGCRGIWPDRPTAPSVPLRGAGDGGGPLPRRASSAGRKPLSDIR